MSAGHSLFLFGLSVFALFTIPTLLFTLTGRLSDGSGHILIFISSGVILFIPLMVFFVNTSLALGVYSEVTKQGKDVLTLTGAGVYFGLGFIVYWIDYYAGLRMHKLLT